MPELSDVVNVFMGMDIDTDNEVVYLNSIWYYKLLRVINELSFGVTSFHEDYPITICGVTFFTDISMPDDVLALVVNLKDKSGKVFLGVENG
jgi:hypothetical protein